ncbi:MAG: hypothetical protein ACKVN9_01360 [Methylophilaceae bacterium]
MLIEIKNVRQIKGEPCRRWFTSDWFDLIVWYEAEEISGFQLCYAKNEAERALTWKGADHWYHLGVDDGENRGQLHKASPMLVMDGKFNADLVLSRFIAESAELPESLGTFIVDRLHGCSRQ